MEKATKIKILIYGTIALLILGGVLLLFVTINKGGVKEDPNETVVHSKVKSDFTVKEMMNVNESSSLRNTRPAYDAKGLTPDYDADSVLYQEANERVLEEQRRIRERNMREDSVVIQHRKEFEKTVNEIKQQQQPQTQPTAQLQEPTLPEPIPRDLTAVKAEEPEEVEPVKEPSKKRFYKPSGNSPYKNTISATVHGEQTVQNGQTLKMRLLEDMVALNGAVIPKGSYISGLVRISGERMGVEIRSAQIDDIIIPVSKTVYDRDGIAGIMVPGNLKAELANEVTESALNEARSGYSGSLIDKGVNAVTTAGSRVLRKQNRVVRVTIKSNYKLYLKDEER